MPEKLRAIAETRQAAAPAREAGPRPADELLHELEVHQIELEMQNEELRRTRVELERSRDRFVDLYEFAPVGYLTLAPDGCIAAINLTGAALIGEERSRLIQRRFARLVDTGDRERWERFFIGARQRGGRQSCELVLHRRDDSSCHVRLDSVLGEPESGGLRVTVSDITERKRAEEQLRIAATAFESQEGMMITDRDAVILRVNQAFCAATGYGAAELVGRTPRLFKSGCHDAGFYAAMWDSLDRMGVWQGEIWDRRKNGEIYPKWMTITAVRGEDGAVSHYVSTQTDISARKAAEEEIKHLAFYDALTGLPNRRLLLDRLHQAVAASGRTLHHAALLFIDLDNFKILNDTLGHHRGDLLLREVAERLATCIREGDTVARLGGDEFVVMLEDLSHQAREAAADAEAVGGKILAALGRPHVLDGQEHPGSASIGVTLFGTRAQTLDELLQQADLAMYQAKAAGRNTLRFFDPEMQAVVTARAGLERDLRDAVRDGQILLHYQAQVDAAGRVTGAEVLARWQHRERGLVYPDEFIPLAEETGLILPLGRRVLEDACRQLAAWAGRPRTAGLTLAVNVSGRQVRQPDFVDTVLAVLEATGADPRRLKLELTESLLMGDVEDTIAKMAALRERGVGFALDDFGTGYSSLTYLKRLPLEWLKIDRSFVMDVLHDPNDVAIVRTIVALARSLGLAVIAEGVETAAQRDFLAGEGCQAYQGYLFSRPLPLAEFEALLAR